jgi:hypothetical protein
MTFMKKAVLTSALFMALSGTTAFAHHPAADIVDPDIYAMIDENVADTPHADLTFDDMGAAMDTAASAMEARDDVDSIDEAAASGRGSAMGTDVDSMMDSRADLEEVANTDAAIDTMTLLEDIDRAVRE